MPSKLNLEENLKKSLMVVVQNQKKDESTKTEEVLQIWKEHLKQHFITEFPHDENTCNPFITRHLL